MVKWEYQNKRCYLENCVVREPCKQRTACIRILLRRFFAGSKSCVMWKLGVCSFVLKISISWKCNSVLAQISELPNGSWIPILWRLTPLCCSKDDVNLELFIADFCGLRHFRYIPFCALCLNDITHFCSWNKLVIKNAYSSSGQKGVNIFWWHILAFRHLNDPKKHTLWTVILRGSFIAFYCLCRWKKDPSEAMKTPGGLSKGFDPVTSLTVHSVNSTVWTIERVALLIFALCTTDQ